MPPRRHQKVEAYHYLLAPVLGGLTLYNAWTVVGGHFGFSDAPSPTQQPPQTRFLIDERKDTPPAPPQPQAPTSPKRTWWAFLTGQKKPPQQQ